MGRAAGRGGEPCRVVGAEVVKEMLFCETVHPVSFGDLLFGNELAGARRHGFQFGEGGLAEGGVAGGMFPDEITDQIRTFQHDAPAGGGGGGVSEIAQEIGTGHEIEHAGGVMNVFLCELNDRAGFDIALGPDVMTDAGGHGAERFAVVVVIGIDDRDRHFRSHLHDEFAGAEELIRAEREMGGHLGADRAIRMEPDVMNSAVDEFLKPGAGEEVIDVRLAKACCDARQEALVEAMIEAAQGSVEHFGFASALIADDFAAFDADEGGDIPESSEFRGDFGRDELAVCEDLKITIGMRSEDAEQVRMQERFAAENAEEAIAMRFGIGDDAVQGRGVDHVPRRFDIDPAALAPEVAAVENGDVKEWGEGFPAAEAFFEPVNRTGTAPSEVHG